MIGAYVQGVGSDYYVMKERSEEEREKAEKRLVKRQAVKKRKLEAAGIEYDLEGVGYVSAS